jgi:hypothetical protein
LKKLEEGKIDIIIGTHALLGKDVKFKDLGVMIIDEEQKFGVAAKEKLKQLRTTVDSLNTNGNAYPQNTAVQPDGCQGSEHHQYTATQPATHTNGSDGVQ